MSDIRSAETLSSEFYRSTEQWEQAKETIFTPSFLYVGDRQQMFRGDENIYPTWILEHYLDEPILFIEEGDTLRCVSNVCTHRGFLLHQHPTRAKKLICKYHGRQFDTQGKFLFMPEFQEAEQFPRPCDDLASVPFVQWRQFLFSSVSGNPEIFQKTIARLESRLSFLDIDSFSFDPSLSKTYNVHAHWALYCDNYLEGFHIPFVHNDLNSIIDYGQYETEYYDNMVLQIGYSDGSGFCFDFPEGHPDRGRHVTAYYYWLYPNFMLNFYPWGVQLNIVRPMTANFTKVEFLYYIKDRAIFEAMQGDKLAEKTEREDEFVVEAVQRGLRSRFYSSGRFSPRREKGVHYFHERIKQDMYG